MLINQTTESNLAPLQLGQRLRQLRLELGLTLEATSRLTGVAKSTLSKIENDQISPTFSLLQKLAKGLGIDMPQLFCPATKPKAKLSGRRDITRHGQGKIRPTLTYEHELLGNQLSDKKMVPFKTVIRARSFDEYKDWIRHNGEEFLLVLSGSLIFYSEYYESIELFQGDSVYYDCAMGHALTSTSVEDAQILWVTAN